MSDRYRALHFAGDVRESVHADGCLGMTEAFVPYEVLDVEYDPTADRSTVHLQPAGPDVMRRVLAAAGELLSVTGPRQSGKAP